jgi:uncharacterized membrane protein (DUF2068 family)
VAGACEKPAGSKGNRRFPTGPSVFQYPADEVVEMLNSPCPHCGSFNEDTATVCYFCKKELPQGADRPQPIPSPSSPDPANRNRTPDYRRPGCVTVYTILIFLSGLLGMCSALYLPSIVANDPLVLAEKYPEIRTLDPQALAVFSSVFKYYLVFLFVYSVGTILVGYGLWTMRNWARVVIIIVQGLSLAASLFALFYTIAQSGGSLLVCGINSLSLVIPGWVFFWFFLNRGKFR